MSQVKITDELLYELVPKAEEYILDQLPPDEKLNHVFSNEFNRKMNRLLLRSKLSKLKNFSSTAKRVAIVAVVAFVIFFTSIMSVKALREKFIKVIKEIYKEFTSILFVTEDNKSDIQIDVIEPSYIPEGFEKSETEKSFTSVQVVYSNDENVEILYEQSLITNNHLIIDTEDTGIEKLQICGKQIYHVFRKGIHNFIWYEDEFVFNLISPIDKNELLKMIESILASERK